MPVAPRTPALQSAGVLAFRRLAGLELLLGHMGGPFWSRKQEGAWSVPKGLLEPGEDALTAARREFAEETGLQLPEGPLLPLGDARTSAGKTVTIWALESDVDVTGFSPGTFSMQWPPRSGRTIEAAEIDVLRWVPADEAVALLTPAQRPFVARLRALLDAD